MSERMSSEGRMSYDAIAEELSDPNMTLDDLDQTWVEQARDYAKRSHKRWPPRPQTSGWTFQIISIKE
jgi:hypothetical protein